MKKSLMAVACALACMGSMAQAAQAPASTSTYYVTVPVVGNSGTTPVTPGGGGNNSAGDTTPVADGTLLLSAATLPVGYMNDNYTGVSFYDDLSLAGGANLDTNQVTWSLSGTLPAGIVFDSGYIYGTPSKGSTTNFSVTASYQGQTATQAYSLVVNGLGDPAKYIDMLVTSANWSNGDVVTISGPGFVDLASKGSVAFNIWWTCSVTNPQRSRFTNANGYTQYIGPSTDPYIPNGNFGSDVLSDPNSVLGPMTFGTYLYGYPSGNTANFFNGGPVGRMADCDDGSLILGSPVSGGPNLKANLGSYKDTYCVRFDNYGNQIGTCQ